MPKQVPLQPEAKHIKKLRKREQRLLGCLEEAQERYESAQARLQRAQARLQKRQERLERLYGRLALLHQQIQAITNPVPETMPSEESELPQKATEPESIAAEAGEPAQKTTEPDEAVPSLLSVENTTVAPAANEASVVAELAEPAQLAEEYSEYEAVVAIPPSADVSAVVEPVSMSQRALLIGEARAVAETAEEAAQIATMRADHMLDHLEQMLDGRYLSRELEQLQAESATLSLLAHDARHTVDMLVQLSAQSDQQETVALLAQEIERQRQTLAAVRMGLDFSMPDSEECVEPDSEKDAFEDGDSMHPLSGREQWNQQDEEEKEVETVAAMIVADVAAAAAAEAEALAEACSIRTRNAYIVATQADQALVQLQSAIQSGTFAGGEAQVALQLAERASTEAHAALADAEAAEEEAVSAAINAEAEAEVAEGMAFATREYGEWHESLTQEEAHPQSSSVQEQV